MDSPGVASQGEANAVNEFRRLLSRSSTERCREFRYRFAQCAIFGLPVLGLQWIGPLLSARPDEASRWVPLLQAILTGWICYIGALPMGVEALILIRRRWSIDGLVAAVALLSYLYSLTLLVTAFLHPGAIYRTFLFHAVVSLLATWNGLRWAWIRREIVAA
jgi:cation transport ATPase